MNLTKEAGKRVPIVLDRNDVESAVRQFICSCHPEFAIGYTFDINVPKQDVYGDPFMITAATKQPWNQHRLDNEIALLEDAVDCLSRRITDEERSEIIGDLNLRIETLRLK